MMIKASVTQASRPATWQPLIEMERYEFPTWLWVVNRKTCVLRDWLPSGCWRPLATTCMKLFAKGGCRCYTENLVIALVLAGCRGCLSFAWKTLRTNISKTLKGAMQCVNGEDFFTTVQSEWQCSHILFKLCTAVGICYQTITRFLAQHILGDQLNIWKPAATYQQVREHTFFN